MLDEMPEVGPYMYNDDHSFIRFVFECRKRLIQHSREEDINQQYQKCHQRYGEKAVEYIKRLQYLRERAVGWTAWGKPWEYQNTWKDHLEIAEMGLQDPHLIWELIRGQPETAQQLSDLIRKTEEAFIRIARFGHTPDDLVELPKPVITAPHHPVLPALQEQPILDQAVDEPEREEIVKALTSIQNLTSLLYHLDQLASAGELTSATYLACEPPSFESILQGVEPRRNLAEWFLAWCTILTLVAACCLN